MDCQKRKVLDILNQSGPKITDQDWIPILETIKTIFVTAYQ